MGGRVLRVTDASNDGGRGTREVDLDETGTDTWVSLVRGLWERTQGGLGDACLGWRR